MQTFLPYGGFAESAGVLDKRRLNKQRIEAFQILCAITDPLYGWQSHPAVNMWRGYDQALLHYALVMCETWNLIGGADNTDLYGRLIKFFHTGEPVVYPDWLGDETFHLSHRANLYFKDPEHYGKFWKFDEQIPYFWPSSKEK